MAQFRKRPVVVEAEQFTGDGIPALYKNDDRVQFFSSSTGQDTWLRVYTLEANMLAQPGDYIITGIKGEVYPCKPDIFEATYDAVDDEMGKS